MSNLRSARWGQAATIDTLFCIGRWVDPLGAIIISVYIVWRWVVMCKGQVSRQPVETVLEACCSVDAMSAVYNHQPAGCNEHNKGLSE